MRRTGMIGLTVSLALALTSSSAAQDAFLDEWQNLRSENPADVTFSISTEKSQFFLGELIPLRLTFSRTEPTLLVVSRRLQDRIGRVNGEDEFRVEGAAPTEDPLRGLQGEGGGMGGLSGGSVLLSDEPLILELTINEWVRFLSPGVYRFYILTRRISRAQLPASGSFFGLPPRGSPLSVVSNVVTIEVLPAPDDWVREQIAAATRILDRPMTPEDSYEERVHAGRVLRYMDRREAAFEMARRLDGGQDVNSLNLHMGILSSPFQRELVPFLEQRLVAADQPVWERYLETLSHLAELIASDGPIAPHPEGEEEQRAWQEEYNRRRELRREKRDEHVERLVDSFPRKQPEARAVSLKTLLNTALDSAPRPPWYSQIVTALVENFRNLPAMTQRELLESRWETLKGPAMIPVLREIYDHPPLPRYDPPVDDLALRRLYELAPAEGRRLLLAEIERPTRQLSWSTLSMLSEESLPELNDVFTSKLEAGWVGERLIVRYATGDILAQVKVNYERRRDEAAQQNQHLCLPAVIYYFLKHDPQYGEQELRRALAAPGPPPICYNIAHRELGAYAMSPALERIAIEYLDSPLVVIKDGAAELLGKHGSAAALNPLWETMAYFREYWRGKETELLDNREGVQFERTLRAALAQADAWFLGEQELNRLLSLCSTDWCKQDVGFWIQQAKSPIQLQFSPVFDGVAYSLAQYELRSEEELRKKLAQFPRGTAIRVERLANEEARPEIRAARERAEQAALAAGHQISP